MRRFPMRPLAVLATVGTLVLTGCGTETGAPGGRVSGEKVSGERVSGGQVAVDGASVDGASAGRASGDRAGRTIRAQKVMQLTRTHPETGMTLLEGPVLDESGRLYVVDVTAPEGKPKVMRVDVRNKTFRAVSTEGRAAYTSAQFSPYDGRLYLTDFAHGEIVSMAADGSDRRTFFSGGIDGAPMNPDDLAFDREGHLYISDSRGLSEGTAQGRVVRISRDGEDVDVLARDLAAPNGISFDEEYRGLWFSELTENRISYLRLDARGKVTSRHTAIRVDGGIAQTDSIAVDADGNLYQGLHGRPAMAVYSRNGEHLATVELPARTTGLESATNVAITPGGTKAYMTVSGPGGGFLYTFDALAKGTRQSNGG
ncbi:SMP-30/gluconolactonase/LRE family protein [Streptomyces bacillaris]|uniref:SMP-30/gluconolactonase/LRE family protein n=1 Tax=Streptomyces bacillaris TaxID=68179 RepID=UPI003627B007